MNDKTAKRRPDEYGRSVLLELASRWSEGIFMGVPVDELDLTIDEMKGLAVLMRDMVTTSGACEYVRPNVARFRAAMAKSRPPMTQELRDDARAVAPTAPASFRVEFTGPAVVPSDGPEFGYCEFSSDGAKRCRRPVEGGRMCRDHRYMGDWSIYEASGA